MNHQDEAKTVLGRAAWGLWGGVAFVALVFLLRSLSGAFTRELSTLAACCGATLAAAVSLAAFWCDRFAANDAPSRSRFWQLVLFTVLPPAVLGGILVPSSSSLGIAWITILAIASAVTVFLAASPDREASMALEEHAPSIPLAGPEEASQWMTRRLLSEGGETWDQMEGRITVDFAAGQQHATFHLAICPPMSGPPEIECEVPGELEVEWKAAAVHPYGVRIELRRPRPAEESARIALGYSMAALHRPEIENAA